MSDSDLANEILDQILTAANRIKRRCAGIGKPDDFLVSEEGIDKLDAICMMLIVIGENLKNLDKVSIYPCIGKQIFKDLPERGPAAQCHGYQKSLTI